MQLLTPRYLFLELIQGAVWVQNSKNDGFKKNVSIIVKIVHSEHVMCTYITARIYEFRKLCA